VRVARIAVHTVAPTPRRSRWPRHRSRRDVSRRSASVSGPACAGFV